MSKTCIHYYNVNYWKHCIGIWAKNTFSSSGGRKKKKNSHATLPKICYFCLPFCFFNPPFCKPSVLLSRKHLFATYPAPYGHWLSTLTPLQANTIIIFITELAPCLTFILLISLSCISLITHISLKRQTSIQKITK